MKRRDINDNPVVIFLTALADLLIGNLLWIICSLPILTIGASTKALYNILLKIVRKEPVSAFREFFQAFREDFVSSLALTFLCLIGAVIFTGDLWYAMSQPGLSRYIFLFATAVAGVVTFSILTWAFPLAANFKNDLKGYILNSLAMAFVAPGKTLMIWCMYAFPILLLIFVPMSITAYLLPFYIMFGISGPCYFAAQLQQRVFDKVAQAQNQTDTNSEEN